MAVPVKKEDAEEVDVKCEPDLPITKQEMVELDVKFEELLNHVPINEYGFDSETLAKIKEHNHEIIDGKLSKKQKRQLGKHGKHRLAKADGDQIRTVTEVLTWLHEEEKREKDTLEIQKRPVEQKPPKATISKTTHSNEKSDREQLVEKLRSRIDELKKQRRANPYSTTESKRLKRRISKIKLKDRLAKQKISLLKADKALKSPNDPPKKKIKSESEHIKNEEGKLVFSKFDFAVSGVKPEKEKKKTGGEFEGKDYKKLLEKVDKQKEKVEKLKNVDVSKAKAFEQKVKWNSAIQKAKGAKVKSDPELLRKAIKRKEQKKKATKRKWGERLETQKNQKQQKQEKRTQNIQARKDAKVNKKMDKLKKKGRLIPGF